MRQIDYCQAEEMKKCRDFVGSPFKCKNACCMLTNKNLQKAAGTASFTKKANALNLPTSTMKESK